MISRIKLTGKGIDLLESNERKEQVTGRNDKTGKSKCLVGVKMTGKSKWLVEGDMTGKWNYLLKSNEWKKQVTSRNQKTGKSNWLVGITDREEQATCLNQVTRKSKWLVWIKWEGRESDYGHKQVTWVGQEWLLGTRELKKATSVKSEKVTWDIRRLSVLMYSLTLNSEKWRTTFSRLRYV